MTIPFHKDTIMVHCLATPPAWGKNKTAQQAVEEVRVWHTRDRGWKDIAYAEIIDYAGNYAPGRDLDGDGDVWEETGAGASGWNKNTIHLALVGGQWPDGRWGERTDKFSDHFTAAQDATLRQRIAAIQAQSERPMKVIGHNEVDPNKGCPAFDVPSWLATNPNPAPPPRTSPTQSRTVQASAAQIGTAVAGGASAVAALDGTAQIVALAFFGVIALAALWIMRERLKKWSKGDR